MSHVCILWSRGSSAAVWRELTKCYQSTMTSVGCLPPCRVGDSISDIDTPALLLDLDSFHYNLELLPAIVKEKFPKVAVRPHTKAHKCPEIAHYQIAHGATGVCCQTLTEAHAMVQGGIKDILVSNELIGQSKLRRLASLTKQAKISICVDNFDNARDISVCAHEIDSNVGILIEVDVGQKRCGVRPGKEAVDLAKKILKLPNVTFNGIQCYQGANQHNRKAADRKQEVDNIVSHVQATLKLLADAGFDSEKLVVTGGGTGTFFYEGASGVFTEIQPGSYVLMDADYSKNLGEDGLPFCVFQQSLYILTTVQSVPSSREWAVVDAGMKALSLDSGPPVVKDDVDMVYTCAGDEHGIITPTKSLQVGNQLRLIPGHCDPTVNMYDWIVAVRGHRVEALWRVAARNPGV